MARNSIHPETETSLSSSELANRKSSRVLKKAQPRYHFVKCVQQLVSFYCLHSIVWLDHSPAIYLLMKIWIVFILLLLHIKLWTSSNKYLCGKLFFLLLGKYLWMEWMGHVVGVGFILNVYQVIFKVIVHFSIPTNSVWEFQLLHISPTLGIVNFLKLNL